jgi:hypothetical protein
VQSPELESVENIFERLRERRETSFLRQLQHFQILLKQAVFREAQHAFEGAQRIFQSNELIVHIDKLEHVSFYQKLLGLGAGVFNPTIIFGKKRQVLRYLGTDLACLCGLLIKVVDEGGQLFKFGLSPRDEGVGHLPQLRPLTVELLEHLLDVVEREVLVVSVLEAGLAVKAGDPVVGARGLHADEFDGLLVLALAQLVAPVGPDDLGRRGHGILKVNLHILTFSLLFNILP